MAKKHIDRASLIAAIRELKELSNEQKSDILQLISEQKKYGLVWEDSPEEVEEKMRTTIPVLTEDKDKFIDSYAVDAPNHILIEGDNLEALTALTYTHEGKIDVIYIDPPYNTGAKNWKYNNDYIDKEDSYKHSKFISFIIKRLSIAKRLLSENGFIICTIDDYEEHNVRHMMDYIFGEENRLATFVIKNNPSGRSTVSGASISHEYALIYAKSESTKLGRLPRSDKQISRYKEHDDKGMFEWVNFRKHGGYKEDAPTMFYPIYVKQDGSSFRIPNLRWDEKTKEYDILELPLADEITSLPYDEDGRPRRWKWSLERARTDTGEMTVRLDRNKVPAVYIKSRMKDEGMLPLTVWDDKKYSSTEYGTNLLNDILGRKLFDYPKSLHAVQDCLFITLPSNGIVLDFFAGSGTTLHATMQLNAEDGGHRQCILCTNNENGICEEVTYERNKRVINGYTKTNGDFVEGLHGNKLRYYKIEHVERENNVTNRTKLIRMSTDLLCVKENLYDEVGQFGSLKFKKSIARYFADANKQMLIVYEPRAVEYIANELRKDSSLATKHRPLKIYVYSDGAYAYTDEFEGLLDKVELTAMPNALSQALHNVLPEPITNDFEEGEIGND